MKFQIVFTVFIIEVRFSLFRDESLNLLFSLQSFVYSASIIFVNSL